MKSFRFKIKPAKEFKILMEAIGTIIDTARFHLSKDKMVLKAMDPSHVAMVFLDLPGAWFEESICKGLQQISVDVSELNKVLKRAGDEVLYLMPDIADNKLCVEFQGDTKRVFRIGIISVDEEEPEDVIEVSDIFQAQFSLDPSMLDEIVKDTLITEGHISFTLSEQDHSLTVLADGGIRDVSIHINKENFVETAKLVKTQSTTYSMDYVKDVIKAQAISTKVDIEFATEKPIKFEFSLRDKGKLTYVIAPYVKGPDEEDLEEDEEFHDGQG